MDSLPTNPSYFVSDSAQSATLGPPNELSMAQIDGLFARMPPSDRDRFITELARCRSNDLASASPLILFMIGGSYLLDRKLKVGPFRVPFYLLIGIGTASLSALLFRNSCAQRVRRALADEFQRESQNGATIGLLTAAQQQQQTNNSNRSAEFFRAEGPPPGWGGVATPPLLPGTAAAANGGGWTTFSGTPTTNTTNNNNGNAFGGGGGRDQ